MALGLRLWREFGQYILVGAWSNSKNPDGLYDGFDHVSTEIITSYYSKNDSLLLIFISFPICTL